MIFINSIFPGILVWLFVVIYYLYKHGSVKINKFRFSVLNYYLLLLPLVIGLLIFSYKSGSFKPLIVFAVFGVMGVIGEIILDFWWQNFFARPLWVYKLETAMNKYTSWLNFIPWGLGGFLYYAVATRIIGTKALMGIEEAVWVFFILVLIQVFLFKFFKSSQNFKFREISLAGLIIFYAPVILALVFLWWLYGSDVWRLAVFFAIVPTVAEYLFGKACHFFISRKLWDYTYLAVDNGHFTILAVPLFCIGGFFFLALARIMNF